MNERLSTNDNLEQAIIDVSAIRQEVAMMGANDFEIPTINRLIESLKRGECSPAEAIEEAIKIRDRKHDDH